jgi:hypothetical protein
MAFLKIIGGMVAAGVLIYLKYRQQKWISEQCDYKADVQTLFAGKK